VTEYESRFRVSFHRSTSWFRLWKHSDRRWVLWTRYVSVWLNLGKPLPKDDGWPE
jgi:hypothetical protein